MLHTSMGFNHKLASLLEIVGKEFHLFSSEGMQLAVGTSTGVLLRLHEEEHALLRRIQSGQLDDVFDDPAALALVQAVVIRMAAQNVISEMVGPVRSALVNLTNDCNLSCSYCYGRYGHQGSDQCMSPDMAMATADRFAALGIDVVGFFGGEPLMNREAMHAFVAHSENRGYGFSFAVTTNGTLVTEGDGEFFRQHKFLVSVSIDGNESTHNACRPFRNGAPTYRDVVRGIGLLRDAEVLEALEITVPRQYCGCIEEMVTSVAKLWPRVTCTAVDGCSGCSHQDEVVGGRDLLNWYEGMFAASDQGINLGGIEELRQLFEDKTFIRRPYVCSGIMRRVVVDFDGNVYPCPELIQPEYLIDNISVPEFDQAFPANRERVLGLLHKDRVERTWYRDLLDTCAVRLNPSSAEGHWEIADDAAISKALEYALGRIVANSPNAERWDLFARRRIADEG